MRMLVDCKAPQGCYRVVRHTRPGGQKHRELIADCRMLRNAEATARVATHEAGYFCVVIYDDQGRSVSGQMWSSDVVERATGNVDDDWMWR